jgi:hypothetical protein
MFKIIHADRSLKLNYPGKQDREKKQEKKMICKDTKAGHKTPKGKRQIKCYAPVLSPARGQVGQYLNNIADNVLLLFYYIT